MSRRGGCLRGEAPAPSSQQAPSSEETSFPERIDALTPDHLWAALDAHLSDHAPIDRDQLLKRAAATLGHDLTRRIRSRLNKHIRKQVDAGRLEERNNWAQIRRG